MAPSYAPSEPASVSDDLNDYDVISDADPRSLDSSIADLRLDSPTVGPNAGARPARELPLSDEARTLYETAGLSPEDIQAYVQRTVSGPGKGAVRRPSRSRGCGERERSFRIYVDGIFETLHVG